MGWETLPGVRDMSGDPWGWPGRVGGPLGMSVMGRGPSGRSGTGGGTLKDGRDVSLHPWGGLRRVRDIRDELRDPVEFWDGSGDPRGGR